MRRADLISLEGDKKICGKGRWVWLVFGGSLVPVLFQLWIWMGRVVCNGSCEPGRTRFVCSCNPAGQYRAWTSAAILRVSSVAQVLIYFQCVVCHVSDGQCSNWSMFEV